MLEVTQIQKYQRPTRKTFLMAHLNLIADAKKSRAFFRHVRYADTRSRSVVHFMEPDAQRVAGFAERAKMAVRVWYLSFCAADGLGGGRDQDESVPGA